MRGAVKYINGYFMLSDPKHRKLPIVFLVSTLLAAILRGYFALRSGFWCDEIAWLNESAGPLGSLIQSVRVEPGPLGFLDLVLIALPAKALIRAGLDPHLALRVFTVLLTLLVGILPLSSKAISAPTKILWCVLAVTSSALNAMAINARPIAALIFFSSFIFSAALEIINENPDGRGFLTRLLIFLLPLAAFSHPYILFSVGLLTLVIFLSGSNRTKALLGSSVVVYFILFSLWQFKIRPSLVHEKIEWSIVAAKFFSSNTKDYMKESLRSLLNPGIGWKWFAPILLAGGISIYRRNKTEFAFVLLTCLMGLALPLALDYRYSYFFSPRQSFFAFPAFLWLSAQGYSSLLRYGGRFRNLALVAGLAIFSYTQLGGTYHWMIDKAPHVDVPRYDILGAFDRARSFKNILVMSRCHVEVAELYADKKAMTGYFAAYSRSLSPRLPKSLRIVKWTDDEKSCGGWLPDLPDDPKLLTKLRPEDTMVFLPYNVRIPVSLEKFTCFTETGRRCLRR